uniref:Uncharacterized protein n=1 Tax=Leclercia adecarboxylata TaxID=83655 RepID=A0A5B8KES1_9ENTR|nr:Hypothetical protein [Leclercia adecarboxylata]
MVVSGRSEFLSNRDFPEVYHAGKISEAPISAAEPQVTIRA